MNKQERYEMVRAMETIARSVNNEEIFVHWLINGVADGDIDEDTEDEELEYYIEDDNFQSLMNTFAIMLHNALYDGGLYCDGITSLSFEGK